MRGLIFFTALVCAGQDRLTLKEAEEQALRNNPQIATAALTADAARYLPEQIRAALQPQVTAGLHTLAAPEGSRLTGAQFTNPALISRLGFGVGVNQLLTDFGRTKLIEQSAISRSKAELENVASMRAAIIIVVRQAFFAALRAANIIRVAKETVTARALVVEQVRALADANLRSELDLRVVEVSLSEAKLVLAAAENERNAALADLSGAMGYAEQKDFELVYTAPPPDGLEVSNELLREALANRPDLAARKLEAASAAQIAQAEQKLDKPVVTATGGVGYSPVHNKQLTRDEYVAGGVSVNLPIFNGGAFKARQAEAAVRARVAESRVKELENRIARDINVAQLNMRTAKERMELTRQLIQQADQSVALARTRYELGLSSIVELSQAQLAKLQAEIQSAAAAFEYQMQHSLLEFHTGRLK